MDCSTFSFDLHVLGTPPALILSQDQTLVCNLLFPTEVGNRLPTESIDKPYLVRPLEMNLKHPSHDWHVQPVVKDRKAFSALGGAFGGTTAQSAPPVLEAVRNIAGEAPAEFAARDPSGTERHPAGEGVGLRLASLDASLLRSAILPALFPMQRPCAQRENRSFQLKDRLRFCVGSLKPAGSSVPVSVGGLCATFLSYQNRRTLSTEATEILYRVSLSLKPGPYIGAAGSFSRSPGTPALARSTVLAKPSAGCKSRRPCCLGFLCI